MCSFTRDECVMTKKEITVDKNGTVVSCDVYIALKIIHSLYAEDS